MSSRRERQLSTRHAARGLWKRKWVLCVVRGPVAIVIGPIMRAQSRFPLSLGAHLTVPPPFHIVHPTSFPLSLGSAT